MIYFQICIFFPEKEKRETKKQRTWKLKMSYSQSSTFWNLKSPWQLRTELQTLEKENNSLFTISQTCFESTLCNSNAFPLYFVMFTIIYFDWPAMLGQVFMSWKQRKRVRMEQKKVVKILPSVANVLYREKAVSMLFFPLSSTGYRTMRRSVINFLAISSFDFWLNLHLLVVLKSCS